MPIDPPNPRNPNYPENPNHPRNHHNPHNPPNPPPTHPAQKMKYAFAVLPLAFAGMQVYNALITFRKEVIADESDNAEKYFCYVFAF